MSTATVTETVRNQYEDLPYPPRNPEDDRKRLPTPSLEQLACLNHHCYAGRRNMRENFRALVAGGGTGDATIYLAWQLRRTNATIIHLDLSQASIDVARKRARVCNLNNIKWMRGSLLDLPTMDLPKFDYINCCGVLHHLQYPPAGLAALRSVLKDDGAMGLMLYGRIGRAAVYLMQDLMRRVNQGVDDTDEKLRRATQIIGVLPPTNLLKRSEDQIRDHILYGLPGIYDSFLHSQDRAYTAEEVHDFLASAGMHMSTYIPRYRFLFRPESLIRDESLLEELHQLPLPEQQTIMEMMWGNIKKHEFWAVPSDQDTRAQLDEKENVPLFLPVKGGMENLGPQIVKSLLDAGNLPIPFNVGNLHFQLYPGRLSNLVFRYIDGKRTLGEIFDQIRRDCSDNPTDEAILAEFSPNYQVLGVNFDYLLLAHKSVAQFFQED